MRGISGAGYQGEEQSDDSRMSLGSVDGMFLGMHDTRNANSRELICLDIQRQCRRKCQRKIKPHLSLWKRRICSIVATQCRL